MVTFEIFFQMVWFDVSWLKRVTHSSGLMCQMNVTCTFPKTGTQPAPILMKPVILDWFQ